MASMEGAILWLTAIMESFIMHQQPANSLVPGQPAQVPPANAIPLTQVNLPIWRQ